MKNLPVPRLQIVWKDTEDESNWGKEFEISYEMVLYEGEESLLDVRANNEEGLPSKAPITVDMGCGAGTRCSGGNLPYNHDGTLSTPFRDGCHIMRDSIRLGNLPMYVIYGDKVEEIEQMLVEKE